MSILDYFFNLKKRDYNIELQKLIYTNPNLNEIKQLIELGANKNLLLDCDEPAENINIISYLVWQYGLENESIKEIIDYFIEEGININHEDSTSWNFISYLLQNPSDKTLEYIDYLVKNYSANVYANGFKLTDLILYAKKSEVENNTNALDIIKFVFEKGFVITIKEYVTLLMNSERTDIIQYLSTKINTN